MVVPIYGNFDHFPLKLMPIDLFHTLSPFLSPRAVPAARTASIKAPERARRFLPLYFLDPFLYQRNAGFMLYTLRPPLSPNAKTQKGRAPPTNTVDAARPLKRRYEFFLYAGKKDRLMLLSVCLSNYGG